MLNISVIKIEIQISFLQHIFRHTLSDAFFSLKMCFFIFLIFWISAPRQISFFLHFLVSFFPQPKRFYPYFHNHIQFRKKMSCVSQLELQSSTSTLSNNPQIIQLPTFERKFKQYGVSSGQNEKEQIKFSVVEVIQNRQNCRLVKVRQKRQTECLTLKITRKFESEDFHFLHQTSQVAFLTKVLLTQNQNLVSINNVFFYKDNLFCLMEYICGGDLAQYIHRNTFAMTSDEKTQKLHWIRNLIRQVVDGLEAIHEMGFVYRDLKPENILVTHEGKIKLCDFGIVIQQGSVDNSLCGTPEYMAPERMMASKKNLPIETSVDMWSLGILTYELIKGETPYPYENNIKKLVDEIYNGYIQLDEFYPQCVRHFIMNLLQPNPKKRLTLERVKEHDFLKDCGSFEANKWWKCYCQK